MGLAGRLRRAAWSRGPGELLPPAAGLIASKTTLPLSKYPSVKAHVAARMLESVEREEGNSSWKIALLEVIIPGVSTRKAHRELLQRGLAAPAGESRNPALYETSPRSPRSCWLDPKRSAKGWYLPLLPHVPPDTRLPLITHLTPLLPTAPAAT